MGDAVTGYERAPCPACGMMLRPLWEGHVCTGPADPTTMLAADRPAWWRLDNPDDVRVEILHRDPHEHELLDEPVCSPTHTLRVVTSYSRHTGQGVVVDTTTTATAELVVRPQAEFDALFDAGRITPGMLHFCMIAPPSVGEWTRIEPLETNDPPTGIGGGIIAGVRG